MAIFVSSPETFFVEELPAYLPSGEGSHTYVWIEKRGLSTAEAIRRLARALDVQERDVGSAGLKDRHATTRQWLSLPQVEPERALAAVVPDLRILEAQRHGNKLRTGHLRGNRFEVVLTGTSAAEAGLIEEGLRRFASEGIPNRYGDQRFGAAGDNVEAGKALLRGERRERDHRRRRLLLSSVQSAVFNRALELRATSGGLLRVRPGDVLQKTTSGGLFTSAGPEADQARVDAGELVPTGPMPGGREVGPTPGSEADALERQALADVGVTLEELAGFGRELPGARRPVVVKVTLGTPPLALEGERATLRFSLPSGSYATVVLQALAGLDPARPVVTFPGPTLS